MRTKEELDKLCETLTLRERYALDAYIRNIDDKRARRLAFQMSLEENPMWAKGTWTAAESRFYKRNDVTAYLELDALRKAKARAGDAAEGTVAKDYATIIRELERDRQDAKDRQDIDNYQKFSKLLLDYMKSNKEDDINEEKVHYYVPVVCVDNCPLYKRQQDIMNRKNDIIQKKREESL